MDKIWLDNGHDFRMKPYQVLSTSDQVGMIEVKYIIIYYIYLLLLFFL